MQDCERVKRYDLTKEQANHRIKWPQLNVYWVEREGKGREPLLSGHLSFTRLQRLLVPFKIGRKFSPSEKSSADVQRVSAITSYNRICISTRKQSSASASLYRIQLCYFQHSFFNRNFLFYYFFSSHQDFLFQYKIANSYKLCLKNYPSTKVTQGEVSSYSSSRR